MGVFCSDSVNTWSSLSHLSIYRTAEVLLFCLLACEKKVHFTPFDKFDSYVVYSEPSALSSQYKHTSTIFTHSYFICDGRIRGLFNITQ